MKTHKNRDMNSSAANSHAGMTMKSKATRSQLLAVTLLTLIALVFGILIAALYGNFTMSARNMQQGSMPQMDMGNQSASGMNAGERSIPGMDMGSQKSPAPVSSLAPTPMSSVTQMNGLVMPPGTIMTADTSMEAMKDMAAVDLTKIAYTAPVDTRGDRTLTPKLENGVKVFNLDVSLIKWNILPDVQVAAYAFNRQIPGPRIRVTEGDRVRIEVKNNLPEPTTVHWHGMILPNNMDGPADITQKPIAPGASYTYEFAVKQAGTYFYHSHKDIDRQQTLGMYGALIVDPKNKPKTLAYDREVVVQIQEWTVKQGYTFPAMPMEGLLPNFFTINGKAYPETETINAKVGEKIRFRFIGSNNAFIHPMHIHGGPFKIVEADGNPVPVAAQIEKDTINVAPGERYDVIWTARNKGKWLLHCHIAHHATNDNVEVKGAGGLTMLVNVT
ncbi:multicopper oxidase family protein [Chroococcidiopsis thermalis]|uniref:Multicopper oxidase type 3 n=1 Tax=Chroococcidiopsis thermalis (strain PCC 7203) TaxID=251229 RepID=K9U833_CHRTP|nr:copper oxidase [Chroococcidiopsis thermalis]AFY91005.1 multicopper oxidase type 3 [Chroococcidiopsis thermalis PCC 7203]